MSTLTLADLMVQNIMVIENKPNPVQALASANTHHLILLEETRPTAVLTMEKANQLRSAEILPIETDWAIPLIVEADTPAILFFQKHLGHLEHLEHLGPVLVLVDTEVKGIITLTELIHRLFHHCEMMDTYFRTLLETVNEAVTVVTKKGTVSHWNTAAQDIYAIPEQAIVGKHIAGFFELERLTTLKILDEGRSVRQAYHRPSPETHVLINASPVLYDGKIIGAISSEQDITQIVRLNETLSSTSSQLRDLQQKIGPSDNPFGKIIGKGQALRRTIAIARKIAPSEATILITGESGVGKELFAEAIHLASPRAKKPFVALNCGAIPTALFESELFGYHGGAFTGADRKGKPGKLELAHGGTFFLDEIGELPMALQVKLLRVLQDKCFYRLGGTEAITVSTRIIAATNRDLEKMISLGEFREDLYYRLNVITLEVPPLRERTEDIPELVQTFFHEFALKYNKVIPSLNPEIMVAFFNYNWPGNVRELHNATERLAVLADEGLLDIKYLPSTLQRTISGSLHPSPSTLDLRPTRSADLRDAHSEELERIYAALEKAHGNKSAAAKLLGISRGTLYYKLKHYH